MGQLTRLVVAVAVLVLVQQSKATGSFRERYSCEAARMDECNSVVKLEFEEQKNDVFTTDLKIKYCRAMKKLFDCVFKSYSTPCSSNEEYLQGYYFVVLAFLRMDRLAMADVCNTADTSYDPTKLQTRIVEEMSKTDEYRGSPMERFVQLAIDQTPSLTVSSCSVIAHKDCVQQFTDSEMRQGEFCGGITGFITCYLSHSSCDEALYLAYKGVIETLSARLVNLYGENQMCTADSAYAEQ